MENIIIQNKINELYICAKELITKKEFNEAEGVLEEILNLIPNKDKGGKTNFTFSKAVEKKLFLVAFKKTNDSIFEEKTDNSSIYNSYAYCKAQLYKTKEAILGLEESLKWNPVNVSTMLELGEIERLQGSYEKFFNITRNAIVFSLSSKNLSDCYSRIGRYFEEIKNYEPAVCMYHVSNSYLKTKDNMDALIRLNKECNIKTKLPTFEMINEVCKNEEIPLGASGYAINAITTLASEAKKENDLLTYKECREIYWDLTKNELEI